jgi:hypothetical protein
MTRSDGDGSRPRAADDFATIRARLEELRRERVERAASHTGAEAQTPPLRDAERRSKERREGLPPPWVPTIFVSNPAGV